MLAVNQNECDRTSERIKTVFAHKIRNGEHLTGAAPYGYVTVNKKLEKDPATREIVEDVINYYFSCFSKRKPYSISLGNMTAIPKSQANTRSTVFFPLICTPASIGDVKDITLLT